MKVLSIDTSNNYRIRVGLNRDFLSAKAGPETPQELINLIRTLLQKHQVGLGEIDQLKVEVGPGSYTGLRVGIAVANALGYALGIPVNGQKITPEMFIKPRYR